MSKSQKSINGLKINTVTQIGHKKREAKQNTYNSIAINTRLMNQAPKWYKYGVSDSL